MRTLIIPYHRNQKHSEVVFSEDTRIDLHDTHLEIFVNGHELIPKDEDDLLVGMKESRMEGSAVVLKSHIVFIDTGWSNSAQCYDFGIYTTSSTLGYNCKDKKTATEQYEILKDWLLR